MSILSEIQRISGKVSESLAKVAAKGVAVPDGAGVNELPGLIESISGSGGGGGGFPNGTEWSVGSIDFTGNYTIPIVCDDTGMCVLGSDKGLYYSSDGENWSLSPDAPAERFLDVAHGNGVWIARKQTGDYWRSTNGINWTAITNTMLSSTSDPIFKEGKFYVKSSSNYSVCSIDGLTWEQTNLQLFNFWRLNGLWLGNKANGGILYSEDGVNWVQTNITTGYCTVKYANNLFVAVSAGSGIVYSTDGKNWVKATIQDNITGTVCSESAFCYGNGRWLAVTSSSSTGILYSDDGKVWNKVILPNNIGRMSDISYSYGVWLGSIAKSNTERKGVMYSYDGVNWTYTNLTSGHYRTNVNVNGKLVAVKNLCNNDHTNVAVYSTIWAPS